LTRSGGREQIEPIKRTIVDGLCDIKAEVEATMVTTSKDKHKLSSFVFSFSQFELRVFFFEVIGVDECGFMSEMF